MSEETRTHTGTHPITEFTCDDQDCWCNVELRSVGPLKFFQDRQPKRVVQGPFIVSGIMKALVLRYPHLSELNFFYHAFGTCARKILWKKINNDNYASITVDLPLEDFIGLSLADLDGLWEDSATDESPQAKLIAIARDEVLLLFREAAS